MRPITQWQTDFLPTPYQERILHALEGRALHTEDLLREVGDPQQFFAGQGGIWELRHWGLVVHEARTGNYRPDAPPHGFQANSNSAAVRLPGSGNFTPRNEGARADHSLYLRWDLSHGERGLRGRHSSSR